MSTRRSSTGEPACSKQKFSKSLRCWTFTGAGPIIVYLLRMLRGPAHAAGFGKLQEFLENGFASFRALENADHFVDTIYERE